MTSTSNMRVARLPSVDIVRGVIMILMALDHVRIYFSGAQFSATDPERTNLVLFLIRWVTHFCAPGFFLVAGTAIFLYMERCGSKREVAKFLVSRGIWLIALELTVIGFAWSFSPGWSWLGVIWSLGWSFLAMAALIYLPHSLVLWGSATFVMLHAIPGYPYFESLEGLPGTLMALLYAGGPAEVPILGSKAILYSILPWLAIMGLGFGIGKVFLRTSEGRRTILVKLGLMMIGLFTLLRLTNFYGNPVEVFLAGWPGEFSASDDLARTVISFLNTDKYPPSPQFALMTLGPLLLLLGALAKLDTRADIPRLLKPFDVVGRVPMFYYVVHLYLIHGFALLIALILSEPANVLFWDGTYPRLRPPEGSGYGSATIVMLWLAAVSILFWMCRWFEKFKRTHKQWWVRYL